ncbi:SpoIIE-like protein with response regulator receiver domain [Spongiibacter sp. IMCC21906]|uniref:SpoIIE family protein phosphatase n=1 Tax=Spongiibacter sp. IMCC21906 TaxID=1620392 RepID=UPI00062DE340|nr:SpoIIE family protein phosphatase [Spongiibacter sp. IMCC21906]AKH68425.1 SpoIIE-like protein with response regulator receiver domain [Spongiibacter sp. IMCC21906]
MPKGQARLLIIDDDEAVRASLAVWFEQSGFVVSQASGGAQALTCCAAQLPNLILCDLNMPGMTGLELLKQLATAHPKIPVIIVSGKGDMSDVIQALKLGAWDYVTKPITDLEVLEHSIELALERARLLAENQAHQRELEAANKNLSSALLRMRADETAEQELQFQLLPKQGQTYASFQFHYALFPSNTLSGDFIDYFAIDHNHIGFYLADVSGHGIPSALVTVMLKNTMCRFLQDCLQENDSTLLNPSATLEKLNTQFCNDGVNKHLTLFYGVIHTGQSQLRYASAGHYPYAIIGDKTSCRYEGYQSPPLGLFQNTNYPNVEIALSKNAHILLSSDGIFELGEDASLEQREAAFLDSWQHSNRNLSDFIGRQHLSEQRNKPDDITFLLVTR